MTPPLTPSRTKLLARRAITAFARRIGFEPVTPAMLAENERVIEEYAEGHDRAA